MTLRPLSERLAQDVLVLNEVSRLHFASIDSRDAYVRYLVQTYHYIVASVPLMRFALATSFVQADPQLRAYLEHHIEEELGHDQWVIDDLAALGVHRSVLAAPPLPETVRLAGAAYYSIAHRHPASLLGYMHALEAAPATDAFLDDLARRFDLPANALVTLREHGEKDTDHRAELAAMIDRHTGDPVIEACVVDLCQQTIASLIDVLRIVTREPAVATAGAV